MAATATTTTEERRFRMTYQQWLSSAAERRRVAWAYGEMIPFVPPTIHHAWIEILSGDSTRRDRVTTRQDDAVAGVAEYWIVDPRPGKESEEFLVLAGDGRDEWVGLDAGGRCRSRVVTGFRSRPGLLRADPLPNPLDCLGEIGDGRR